VAVTLSPPHLELRAEAMAWARRLGSEGAGSLRFSVQDEQVVAEFRLLS
jgi:hypothetical protein